jgi:hypothetical protein
MSDWRIPGLESMHGTTLATQSQEEKPTSRYDTAKCAYISDSTAVNDFVIPSHGPPKPGRYFVTPNNPPGVSSVDATVAGKEQQISPATAGAQFTGTLPEITILPK